MPRMDDLNVALCALMLAEACNVGLAPVIKPDVAALTRSRLAQVDQAYFRAECLAAANARLVAAQAGIDIVA